MLDFAAKEHVPLVDMIPVMGVKNQSAMFMDTVHPTVAGHEIIAGELIKAVESLPNYNAACGATSVADVKSSGTIAPAPLASR